MPFQDSVQWKHISPKKVSHYKEVIDQFVEWNSEHLVDFHAVVIEKAARRDRLFNDGDSEKAYNKFLYQCLLAVHGRYRDARVIRCIHGNRESPYDLNEIRRMLNGKVGTLKNGFKVPYAELKYGNVSTTGPLQMADLLLGAVGSYWNTKKKISNLARSEIAAYFHSECCAERLTDSTPRALRHFDIWKFRLRESPQG